MSEERPVYDVVGGQPFFDALVDRFYRRVEVHPVLRPLYPDDLGPPRRALALFLGQYWGGPTTYSDVKGHPRLRMRHAPFAIGRAERDAWLEAMVASVRESDLDLEIERRLVDYFRTAADHMINTAG